MRAILTVLCFVLLVSPAFAKCDPGESVIRFATSNDTSQLARNRAVVLLRDTLNREMQGKACLQLLRDDALYKGALAVTALQSAQVELAAPRFRTLGGFIGEYRVFDLPFAFRDMQALERFQSGASASLTASVSSRGLVPLGFWHGNFRQMSAKTPIFVPDNIAGMKFKADDAAFFSQKLSALNAISIPVSENDVSVALKTARISAQVSNWEQLQTDKTAEITKGATETNHAFDGFQLVASASWWKGLDPALAKQVKEIIDRTTQQTNFDAVARDTNAKRALMRSGIAIRTLTRKQRKEWRDRLQSVWQDYLGNYKVIADQLKTSDMGL